MYSILNNTKPVYDLVDKQAIYSENSVSLSDKFLQKEYKMAVIVENHNHFGLSSYKDLFSTDRTNPTIAECHNKSLEEIKNLIQI